MKDERLYTLRWAATKIQSTTTEQSTKDLAHEQVKILNEMLGDIKKPESDIKSDIVKGLDWCPFALRYPKKMKTKGKYALKYPRGLLWHHTAGRDGAAKTIEGGIKNGFAFVCIQEDGLLIQAHPVSEWGYHCGESAWAKLTGSLSDDCMGMEINNAGKLTKTSDGRYKTWFGTYLPEDKVRYVTEKEWGCPTGYYHKFTEAQEKRAIEFSLWLKRNDPFDVYSFDFNLGHHEASGKLGIGYWRKNDPGGSLSMPMPEMRDLLKKSV